MFEIVAVDEESLTAEIRLNGSQRRVIVRNYSDRNGEPTYMFFGFAGRPGTRGKVWRMSAVLIPDHRANPNWHRFPKDGRIYNNGWWIIVDSDSPYAKIQPFAWQDEVKASDWGKGQAPKETDWQVFA